MEKAYHYCQLEKKVMIQSAMNAVEMSWASEGIKAEIIKEL